MVYKALDTPLILIDPHSVKRKAKFECFNLIESLEQFGILDSKGVGTASVGLSEMLLWAKSSSHLLFLS